MHEERLEELSVYSLFEISEVLITVRRYLNSVNSKKGEESCIAIAWS